MASFRNNLKISEKLGRFKILLGGESTYTHPTTHEPTIINQNETNRFVTDSEKNTWNGKSSAPNDAQKNSDITKEEIEAKLIGELISHSHASSGGLTQEQTEGII